MRKLGSIGRWLGQRPPAPLPPPAPVPAPPAPKPSPKPPVSAPAPPPKPQPRTVVAVTMLGLDGDSLENVAALVERQCAERHMQPICIIDCNEFGPFRRRRMIVDQVVDAERRTMDAPELPWRLYRHAQFVLLGKRWHPATVISFGRPPDADCLAALEPASG